MPDSMETSYNDWVGRKHAKLKRSTLDCGHANPGDVHYHYWCDRLSCSKECANAGHDCGLFKGSKSGIEEEAVEPEAVVDPPTARPLTLSPETYRALYGEPAAPAADESLEPSALDRYMMATQAHHTLGDISRDEPGLAIVYGETETDFIGEWATGIGFVNVRFPKEATRPLTEEERQHYGGMSLNGQPLAERLGVAFPPVERDSTGELAYAAHPVDAALQPDPNALRHAVSREEIQQLWDQMGFDDEPIDPRPWWRRMLPGGTR